MIPGLQLSCRSLTAALQRSVLIGLSKEALIHLEEREEPVQLIRDLTLVRLNNDVELHIFCAKPLTRT